MKQLLLLLLLLLAAVSLQAQQPFSAPARDTLKPKDTTRTVTIENADRLILKKTDTTNELLIGAGNVFFIDGTTKFYCDSAVRNKNKNIIEAFGKVHINDADSIHAYSDYLIYYIDKKIAELSRNVKLTDGKTVLTTNNLDYDTQLKIGTYKNGGTVVTNKTVINSVNAVYYADLKDVYFKNKVVLKDPGYTVTSDSLLYNTQTQVATFITDTYIKDSSKTEILTSEGFYDLKNKTSRLGKRSIVKDKALTVTGDEMAMEDKTGLFEASGNAVLIDTAQGVTVIANNIKANKTNNTFLATQHPLMIIKQEKDSIYISADTLFSGRSKQDTSKRYFQGFYRVRIFSDSLQAVSDSLYYSDIDSVFQLFHDPIIWANKSQVTGDTIYMYTKNKKAERLYVFENAMMINQAKDHLFNQLKGNTIDAFFNEGNIHYAESKGTPAETVYYIQDEDSSFVGFNNTSARIINMYFQSSELNRVVYKMEVAGTTYPMNQIPEEKRTLRNFKWQEDRRPKTRFELFEDLPPR